MGQGTNLRGVYRKGLIDNQKSPLMATESTDYLGKLFSYSSYYPSYVDKKFLVEKETYRVIVLEEGGGCKNLSVVPLGQPARCMFCLSAFENFKLPSLIFSHKTNLCFFPHYIQFHF